MSTMLMINFRREAFVRERAQQQRRLFALGVWVAYFGAIAVIGGLYTLNGVTLNRRLHQLVLETERLRQKRGPVTNWTVGPNELAQVEHYVQSPRLWRDRLVRLGTLLPSNVKVTSLAVNPQNLAAASERNTLVITGVLRPAAGQDRMQGVMQLVSALRGDSLFAAGYPDIILTSTRMPEASSSNAEFVIECR